MSSFDFVVIGAGIAGASIAAELASRARVLLLEGESQPGYHTTGRSAALFTCAYGPAPIRALTRASEEFLRNPDSPYLDHPLMQERQVIFVSRSDQTAALSSLHEELGNAVTPIDGVEARRLVPLLREGHIVEALCDRTASDVDVAALHQHYLRLFRALGGELRTNARVDALTREGPSWLIKTRSDNYSADTIVNAAGAWCDEVAQLAGTATVGLVPKRRTAMIVSAPDMVIPDEWPMVVDVQEQFLLKPEAGKLLISPADETPSPPCDAQPEELDVAICIDRIETAFDLKIQHVERKWAGLRSFVADKCPVVGFDPDVDGFFWLAGQGGYGIQTAPALAALAAAMALGDETPEYIKTQGIDEGAFNCRRKALMVTK